MLAVSSGILKGIPLKSPRGTQTRPTSERIRQAVFNILRGLFPLENASVADVFAGTGAWGIEALSNGATSAWFIESHPLALRTLQDNIFSTLEHFKKQAESPSSIAPEIHLLKRDVLQSYKKIPVVRVVFCDPPYEKGWFGKILSLEAAYHRVEKGGLLVYESSSAEKVPPVPESLMLRDSKVYGESSVHFFVKT